MSDLPEPAPRRHMHTRNIVCEGFIRDDGLWDIEASILDTKTYTLTEPYRGTRSPGDPVHLMKVRLTLDDTLTVRDIAVVMPETPYPICSEAASRFDSIVGLQIGKTWRSEINKRVGRTNGCTHVRELLFPMATVAFQSIKGWGEDNPPADKPGLVAWSSDSTAKPAFLNGCYAWSDKRAMVAQEYPLYAQPADPDD